MKRLILGIFSFALGAVLVSPPSFAGIDYIKYQEEFMSQKGTGKGPTEEKGFQHKSKYQREQQEGQEVAPQKDTSDKPAGKYERRYWDPSAK